MIVLPKHFYQMGRLPLMTMLFLCIISMANAQSPSILFVGNSYTNGLNGELYALALSGGDTLYVEQSQFGGFTLQQHSINTTTNTKIYSRDWDFVVLQEQSQMPAFPPAQVETDVYPYAAILDSLIKDNNPCTETVFYMTWGRKDGDQQNCQFYAPLCTYEGMQGRLRESYMEMGYDNEATISPAGMAWHYVRDRDSTINLYQADGSHPSAAGKYLTACVFYATLLQKTPVGLTYKSNLDSATAAFLQTAAAVTVLDSMDQWRINANLARANFAVDDTLRTINCMDSASKNADTYEWDFGDGNTDTGTSVSHTYMQDGSYEVCLIVTNNCTADTTCKPVTVGCPPATGNFVFDVFGDTVVFVSTTTNAGGMEWDLGDGNLATEDSLQHIYPGPGTYVVSLVVFSTCGNDTIIDTVKIEEPIIINGWLNPEQLSDAIQVSPNPLSSGQTLTIRTSNAFNGGFQGLRLLDVCGKEVARYTSLQGHNTSMQWTLPTLPSGLYFYEFVSSKGQAVSGKLLIQ